MKNSIAHLIGNGPSRANFVETPAGEDAYGCNLSSFELKLSATFVGDSVVFDRIIKDRLVLPWPIICAETIRKYEKRLPAGNRIVDEMPGRPNPGESTGHCAFKWLIDHGYTTINLWGFDSLTTGSGASDSHTKIPEGGFSPRNVVIWSDLWRNVFSQAENRGVEIVLNA